MSAVPQSYLSPTAYLRQERAAETKSEYFDGQVFAMAGASHRHNLITHNLNRVLGNQLLDRPCEVYAGDMRVKVEASGLYTYPDVVVVCGEPEFEDRHVDTLLNPTVLFEVISPSTEVRDRGFKLPHYRELSSVREVITIVQNRMAIEHNVRQEDETWLLRDLARSEDVLELRSIGCRLTLEDIYRKVPLTPLAVSRPPKKSGRSTASRPSRRRR